MPANSFGIGSMFIGMDRTSQGVFAFGNAVQHDGVNDRLVAETSNNWNPYQTDWSISIWAKGVGGNKANGSWVEAHRSNGSSGCFFGIQSSASFRVMSNFQQHIFAYTPTALFMQDWHHYVITVEYVDASNQQALLYVDGILEETGNFGNAAHSTVYAKLRIGGESGVGGQKFNGVWKQILLMEELIPASEVTDLYNSGDGADPDDALSGTVKNHYAVAEEIGTTTGTITDETGNQDVTMTNFLTPYGVIENT